MARWRSALLIGAMTALVAVHAAAQVIHLGGVRSNGSTATEESADNNIFPTADRGLLVKLKLANELLAAKRHSEAIERLNDILDGEKTKEDAFFQPDPKQPIYRSLKAEARRLIGQMPPEGRELYERACGAQAAAMLKDAVANGDANRLAELAGRFFHTQAGYEAVFLLGMYHLDHGSPLAAALTLKRLREVPEAGDRFEPALTLALATGWLQAGMPEEARAALVALKASRLRTPVVVAGRQVAWFDKDSEAVAWLARLAGPPRRGAAVETENWAMPGGNPARTASAAGSGPLLSRRWEVPIFGYTSPALDHPTLHPALKATVGEVRQAKLDRNQPALPALQPLAVDNTVLMRTAWNLLAVDFATGKRMWEVPLHELEDSVPSGPPVSNVAIMRQPQPQSQAQWPPMLSQRIFDDTTYGTLSSDGRYVFSIEESKPTPNVNVNMAGGGIVIMGGRMIRGDAARAQHNYLDAREVRSGKLAWRLGGPAAGQFTLGQTETYFLGPPLPLRGQLFVLAEVNDEVRLLALDPANKGKLLWKQSLAVLDPATNRLLLPRGPGISPSYADGVLVCPTSAGAVVAVDLATHSLSWAYRFNNGRPSRTQPGMFVGSSYAADAVTVPRWLDNTPVVVEGRVLVTPVEANALYCLNLGDGQPAWQLAREADDLFIGGVHRGKIILVGRTGVRAVRLDNGQPAWSGPLALPAGSAVSGRGYLAGNRYYLPLSTAEVAALDVEEGKLVGVSKSPSGSIPGNLICHRGMVISQGVEGVEKFYQIEAAREAVAAAPADDPQALALRGELLLEEGKRADALASFRRSAALDPDPDTRARTCALLRDALLDALRADFAAHRAEAREVEPLLDDPVQRATFLRLMAAGLQEAGQWRGALEYYVKLADLDPSQRRLEVVDRTLSVRRDRWVQARVAMLRRQAQDDAAKEIDRLVEARRQAAAASGPEAMRQFLDCFGSLPAAGPLRRDLARQLAAKGQMLEAELLLGVEQQSADPATAGAATAELAVLLAQAGRAPEAAECYRLLADRFADVPCRDGKTGKQLVAALPSDGPVGKLLQPEPPWPAGHVRRENRVTGMSANHPQLYNSGLVPLRGAASLFYADATFRFDQNQNMLYGADGWGRPRWGPLPLGSADGRVFYGGYNMYTTYLRAQGHLMFLAMGTKVVGLDPTGLAGQRAKVLWSHDLTGAAAEAEVAGQRLIIQGGGVVIINNGVFGVEPQQQLEVKSDPLGPVTARYVAFQRQKSLVAVDPLTGEPLWVRKDVPLTSEVFGDDEFIFVVPSAAPGAAASARRVSIRSGVRVRVAETPAGPTTALVLRATDGELIGKRRVPSLVYRESNALRSYNRSYWQPTARSLAIALPAKPGTPGHPGDLGLATLGRCILISRTERDARVLALFDPWEQRERWTSPKLDPGTKVSLVGQEAAAVLEPSGHFLLLDLADGRAIADQTLDIAARQRGVEVTLDGVARQSAPDFLALRMGDQYLVLVDTAMTPREGSSFPMNSLWPYPVTAGRLYALDRQGKPVWPGPVEINNQQFLLGQPGRLPVVVFARQTNNQWQLQCIDKRTGRKVFDDSINSPAHMPILELTADPAAKAVRVRTMAGGVTLVFSDEPAPPETKPPKLGSALLKAMGDSVQLPGMLSDGEDPFGSRPPPRVRIRPARPVKVNPLKPDKAAPVRPAGKAVEPKLAPEPPPLPVPRTKAAPAEKKAAAAVPAQPVRPAIQALPPQLIQVPTFEELEEEIEIEEDLPLPPPLPPPVLPGRWQPGVE